MQKVLNASLKESFLSRIVSDSVWGILSKIIAGIVNFITVPFLISYYGKADYGLITLAFSLNAYLRLMELGVSTGAIRYFSIWFLEKRIEKIISVSQSSIVFYGAIGIINTIVFILIGKYGSLFFDLQNDQLAQFEWMMYILSASSIFNWTSYVVNQLLIAHGEITWISKLNTVSSLSNFITAYTAISLNLTLPIYFLLYTITTIMIIPINVYKLRVTDISIIKLLLPKWNWIAFLEILKYSLGIFAMGIFQFSADNLRPLLLVTFSNKGTEVLTDYRVIQTVCLFVTMIGGVFLSVLLPYSSKAFISGDKNKIDTLIFDGTKYITVLLSLIIFGLVSNAKVILILYLGPSYAVLEGWMILWLITLLYLHNAPVSSLVLSSGKTRSIVFIAAFASIVCLIVTALLAPILDVGAAVVGYFLFILIHLIGDYFYNIPYVLKLNTSKIFFKSSMPGALIGAFSSFVVYTFQTYWQDQNLVTQLCLNTVLFISIFLPLNLFFNINKDDIIKFQIFSKKK